jgi:bifunctional UDP-N-acetylglucosamine pyrophosphorylase/glucosamine-1-phosphate N-acetyltransferase
MPCLKGSTVARLSAARRAGGMSLLTAVPDEPRGFGRIVRDGEGRVARIVEEKDADAATRAIDEVNMGVYAFDGRVLVEELPKLSNHNAQKEYYLTDILAAFVRRGLPVDAVELEDLEEALGVNTLQHLAEARWALQARILEGHMARGVQIEDPATAVVEHGVEIGVGSRILPFVVLRSGVRVGAGCEVGPFAHLRAGTVLRDGAEIGNFCEAKNTDLGEHAKAKHLAYLGDATIGAKANIGAGTIFANYDGRKKHKSVVGAGAFIGSGTVVVAPNSIPEGATTGAGAVVAKNAPIGPGETWVGLPAKKHEKRAKGGG